MRTLITILASALFTCNAAALAQNNWLALPEDAAARAVDDGFTARKLQKNERYHELINWKIQAEPSSRLIIDPPLLCAFEQGQRAHNTLMSRPTTTDVKTICDGHITVLIIHHSQLLGKNWPCVLQIGGQMIQPTTSLVDHNPKVETFYPGGLSTQDVAGYTYYDLYTFTLTDPTNTTPTLTYADDYGNHHDLSLNFDPFVKDLATRR